MNVDTVLTRAYSALGKKTIYKSPGAMPSLVASTWPESKVKIDCSGFVAWCLRFRRRLDHPLYNRVNGGWFETTGIHADGMASTGFFTKLADPLPGALLVYPDYVGRDNNHHNGHIGIVTEVNGPGIKGVSRIIHCSLSAYRNLKDAIQITSPDPWLSHDSSIIVWLDGLGT